MPLCSVCLASTHTEGIKTVHANYSAGHLLFVPCLTFELKWYRLVSRRHWHRFYICCIFGWRLCCHPCLLAFLFFLFVFLCLLRRFLVYTSSVLRGAPYTFFLYIKFHLLIKKKEDTGITDS
jgi:hypothetical protein